MKMVVGVQFFLAGKCMHLSFNTQIKNIKKYIFLCNRLLFGADSDIFI